MKALYFNEFGEADVLKYGEVADSICGNHDVLVRTTLIGLNFADIYRRRGTYHIETHQPWINGYEGIGKIVQIGNRVTDYQVGQRVLFVDVPFSNAELVAVPSESVIVVPKAVTDTLAISLGLQGLTADFLAHDLARNEPGSRVLLHGISGGVGQILTQMLVADQIHVDGVASTEAKRQVALRRGAKRVFNRDELKKTSLNGQYDTVFDGVGTTLARSLELVKHRGKVVFYGMAGGQPTPVDPVQLLAVSKSILTGDLWDYLTDQTSRQFRFERVLQYVLAGQLQLAEPTVFALADGRRAHEYLENGQSMGKIVLKP